MSTRSKKLSFVAGLCTALTAGAARADVVYTANPVGQGGISPFLISLDFTDVQVASGSFMLHASGSGSSGASFAGDASGFTDFKFGLDNITPTYVYGTLNASLTFGANDSITSMNISWMGVYGDATVSGSSEAASATFGDDGYRTCGQGYQLCTVATAFTTIVTDPSGPTSPVPEPATFAMLGAGLLGLTGLRRHLITNSIGEV